MSQLLCCQSGNIDTCGVCDGDGGSCRTNATISFPTTSAGTMPPARLRRGFLHTGSHRHLLSSTQPDLAASTSVQPPHGNSTGRQAGHPAAARQLLQGNPGDAALEDTITACICAPPHLLAALSVMI